MTPAARLTANLAALDADLTHIRTLLKELTMPTITLPPTAWLTEQMQAAVQAGEPLQLLHHAPTESMLTLQVHAGQVAAWAIESCSAKHFPVRLAQKELMLAAAREGAALAIEKLAAVADMQEALTKAARH